MEPQHLQFNHKTPVQLRFNDLDIVGHVNNAIYQEYFDIARIEYFRKVFGKEINWKETTLVLVHISINYFEPIFIHEEIHVLSKVTKIGSKSIEMAQQVKNVQNIVKSENKAILVGFNYSNNSSIEIPDEWKNKIVNFEQDTSL